MSVSIVIPLFNKASYIQRALDSVLRQTWKDFELIVVDDGSTDDGAECIARCADPRVRLIRQKNAGPGAARNRGLGEARYELVAFLDADDEWLPEYLARAVTYLAAHPGVASLSLGYRYADCKTDSVETRLTAKGIKGGQYDARQGRYAARLMVDLLAYMSPCSTVSRKSVVLRYGGFFDKAKCLYAEDAYLWLQVLMNETIAVSREILVVFHTEASQLSQRRSVPFPLSPFLEDPEALYRSCPGGQRDLLEQILAIRAVGASMDHAMHGYGREARRLLARYCRKHRPAQYREAACYSRMAALLPFLRFCRSTTRRILRRAR